MIFLQMLENVPLRKHEVSATYLNSDDVQQNLSHKSVFRREPVDANAVILTIKQAGMAQTFATSWTPYLSSLPMSLPSLTPR